MSEEAKSPCIYNCHILDGICQGCYRTSEEVWNWSRFTGTEKIEIIKSAIERKHSVLADVLIKHGFQYGFRSNFKSLSFYTFDKTYVKNNKTCSLKVVIPSKTDECLAKSEWMLTEHENEFTSKITFGFGSYSRIEGFLQDALREDLIYIMNEL
jgi:predicted Fe-S protein YdhL (DUF1289 family)